MKKFAVAAKWCALVSGGGCWFGGSVAAEEDGGAARGEGESEAADAVDLPRPRVRPRRR